MAKAPQESSGGLGHDPLEWLEEDTTADEEATPLDASAEPDTLEQAQAEQAEEPDESAAVASETSAEAAADNPASDVSDGMIKLPETLAINKCEALHQSWRTLLEDASKPILIDASGLEQFDTAGLQLLVSLIKSAKAKKQPISFEGASDALTQRFASFGLETLLQADLSE